MRKLFKRRHIIGLSAALLLIVASWVGNVIYYQSMQLKGPLFIKTYMTITQSGERIELPYLENKSASRKVAQVILDELPGLSFDISPGSSHEFAHQILNTASAQWHADEGGSPRLLEIHEATVIYNDGQSVRLPIGEIEIVPDTRETRLLQSLTTSGSTDGKGSEVVNLTEDAALEQITWSYRDVLEPYLHIRESDKPIDSLKLPLSLKRGAVLSFAYQWDIPRDRLIELANYKPKLQLTFRLKDGRKVRESLSLARGLYLSGQQIRQLVQAGGEKP